MHLGSFETSPECAAGLFIAIVWALVAIGVVIDGVRHGQNARIVSVEEWTRDQATPERRARLLKMQRRQG